MSDTPRPQDLSAVCDYRSDELAKEMLANLIGDKSFDIDDVQWDDSKITVPDDLMSKWKQDVGSITIEDLTSRNPFGSGIFDAIMEAVYKHLKKGGYFIFDIASNYLLDEYNHHEMHQDYESFYALIEESGLDLD